MMMLQTFFVLFPLTAATACAEGPGSCPSNGQVLLQASRQQSLDGMSMLIQKEGSLDFFSPEGSETIFTELQALAEAKGRASQEVSPLEKATLRLLNQTVENTTIALLKGHSDDQAELNAGWEAFASCNQNFAYDSNSADLDKKDLDVAVREHRFCRTNQSQLKAKYDSAMKLLQDFVKQLNEPKKPAGLCDDNKGLLQNALAADKYFSTGLDQAEKLLTWYKDNQKTYAEKKMNNTAAKGAFDNQTSKCNSAQSSLEVDYCRWHGKATAASKSLERCWQQADSSWKKIRDAALDSTSQRKRIYAASKGVQCMISVLFTKNASAAKAKLAVCENSTTDTSKFDLANTTTPNKSNVSALGDLVSKPGDGTWENETYAGLEHVEKVMQCGTAAHLCNSNEKVLSHRCVACEPGKANTPGDDAVGVDTNCSTVRCGANQQVVSNVCVSCSAGMRNSQGDDASGADTSCEPIVCGRGQRVLSNSCHSCPPGTQNEAGGHKATGADSSCDPIHCKQDQHVKLHACHTCPVGKTNRAGDNASGPNTTCDAIECGKDKKVVSNRCKGCPPGKVNEAGDDASGMDTNCTPVNCSSNQRVQANACISCPDGTTGSGGDASGPDTSCRAIKCEANQRVLSNACVPCLSGHTNSAGDDASGGDTTCTKVLPSWPSSTCKKGLCAKCTKWDGYVCRETWVGFTATGVRSDCTTPSLVQMRPMWKYNSQKVCATFCWIGGGYGSVSSGGVKAQLTGWTYLYNPGCKDRKRRDQVTVTVGPHSQSVWTVDKPTWMRSGTFCPCRCSRKF